MTPFFSLNLLAYLSFNAFISSLFSLFENLIFFFPPLEAEDLAPLSLKPNALAMSFLCLLSSLSTTSPPSSPLGEAGDLNPNIFAKCL